MTWTNVYLVCFLFGFSLSAISWVIGVFGFHIHIDPHTHGPHAFHGAHAPHGAHGGHAASNAPSVFSFSTAMAFLAWFGGAGYLLAHYADVWPLVALLIAIGVGATGAYLVFWVMSEVLWSEHENLDPDDYEVIGMVGRVTSPIRAGGTGEIQFQQAGTRRVAGARSDDGHAIARNVEVVITRYERGLAYVRTWEELTRTTK